MIIVHFNLKFICFFCIVYYRTIMQDIYTNFSIYNKIIIYGGNNRKDRLEKYYQESLSDYS